MIINYLKNDLVTVPKRAKTGDLGYDIVATSDPIIVGESYTMQSFYGVDTNTYYSSIDYIEYETSLFMSPQNDVSQRGNERKYHILGFPRSSISKYWLTLLNSVPILDQNFRGHVKLRFGYRFQPKDLVIVNNAFFIKMTQDKIYKKGDKIAQLVPYKNIDANFIGVDELDNTDRGEGGFGSTGK